MVQHNCNTLAARMSAPAARTLAPVGRVLAAVVVLGFANFVFAVPDSWHEDADLHDVHFVDEQFGWAVGDYGTIWHSRDGGETWRRQPCPADCQLSAVHFVDRQTGYAAGGEVVPLTHRTKAVLLRTTDGGGTWQEIPGLLLPWVTRIEFQSAKDGIAVGMCSAMHPGGAWRTNDGGMTWTPLLGVAGKSWVDAAFAGRDAFLVAGDGTKAWLSTNRLHTLGGNASDRNASRLFERQHTITSLSPQIAFSGSTSLGFTADGGNTWQSVPESGLPIEICSIAAQRGQQQTHLWVVGRPATRILHSVDFGGSWQSVHSDSVLPVRRLHFLNSVRGWAVGARGLILNTTDAGQTWKRKRGGGKRMALLGVFPNEETIPWDLLAQTSARDGFRVHIVVLADTTNQNPLLCPIEQRLAAAAAHIGASAEILTGMQFEPTSRDASADGVLRLWQGVDSRAVGLLSEKLTQLLRVYRPDVVLCSEQGDVDVLQQQGSGAQKLVTHLVSGACEYASNPEVFPHHHEQLGLSPWRVSRHLVQRNTRGTAPDLDAIATDRGHSVASLARRARQFVSTAETGDSSWSLFTASKEETGSDVGRSPLGGLIIQYDSPQRRPRTIHSTDLASRRQDLQQQLRSRRIAVNERVVGRGQKRLEQIERLLPDSESAGDLLFQLATREFATAPDETDLILRHLVARHPTHPLAGSAIQWLVTWHSSVERIWHRRAASQEDKNRVRYDSAVQQASATVETDTQSELPPSQTIPQPTLNREHNQDQNTTASVAANTKTPIDTGSALKLAREVKTKRPDLYAEPALAFPFAAATRTDGQSNTATGFYRRLAGLPTDSPWRQCAQRELSLLRSEQSRGAETRQPDVWKSGWLSAKPHLDGLLNDACWEQVSPQVLVADASHVPTRVWIARDTDYLYIASVCAKRQGTRYFPARRPRPRDAQLDEMDRLRICLDVNRDYASWWTIEIDHRGWTHDAWSGGGVPGTTDPSWDPAYYVASAGSDDSWTIEVAIPLDELAPDEYQMGHWAIGVERLVPRADTEMWNAVSYGERPILQGVLQLESRQ